MFNSDQASFVELFCNEPHTTTQSAILKAAIHKSTTKDRQRRIHAGSIVRCVPTPEQRVDRHGIDIYVEFLARLTNSLTRWLLFAFRAL